MNIYKKVNVQWDGTEVHQYFLLYCLTLDKISEVKPTTEKGWFHSGRKPRKAWKTSERCSGEWEADGRMQRRWKSGSGFRTGKKLNGCLRNLWNGNIYPSLSFSTHTNRINCFLRIILFPNLIISFLGEKTKYVSYYQPEVTQEVKKDILLVVK